MSDGRYLVFSVEHLAWWRPGGFGYTTRLSEVEILPERPPTEMERAIAKATLARMQETMQ